VLTAGIDGNRHLGLSARRFLGIALFLALAVRLVDAAVVIVVGCGRVHCLASAAARARDLRDDRGRALAHRGHLVVPFQLLVGPCQAGRRAQQQSHACDARSDRTPERMKRIHVPCLLRFEGCDSHPDRWTSGDRGSYAARFSRHDLSREIFMTSSSL
jgi:hypothetical protein